MQIPWQQLDPTTLEALIESFVLREGTDYGETEVDLATKVAQVRAQLQRGEIVIVWSELHESVSLMPRDAVTSMPTETPDED